MKRKRYIPAGTTEAEIKAIADHYDHQTPDEAVLEDERMLAIEVGARIIPLRPSLSQHLHELAREKKTTIDRLINSLLRKSMTKAA
ncbi:MAG TPA: hypothetical protein PKO06_21405 [Candidatus Ozemobacteraceae bacterium]|nr:hypothetical protein [Candidatus Ozemobacteraceae bacterium]